MIVWVSGASSGLGFHTSLQLKKAGMQVVSGARSYRDREGEAENGCRLYLDVRDEQSMDRFVREALSVYGTPDVLCCCAGVLTLGACEDYTLQELRDVMETNFFGQAMMIKRVLPLMRENGGGKIVLFSSVNGVLAVPYQGAYTASKHAVEGFAEALRMEASLFGVSVCVVEPGDHRSGSSKYRRHASTDQPANPYYQDYRRTIARIDHDEKNGSDPDRLGRVIARALRKKHLPARLLIASPDQKLAVLLHRILPKKLFARFLTLYYGGRFCQKTVK